MGTGQVTSCPRQEVQMAEACGHASQSGHCSLSLAGVPKGDLGAGKCAGGHALLSLWFSGRKSLRKGVLGALRRQ